MDKEYEYESAIKEIDEMLGKLTAAMTNKEYKNETKKIDEMLRELEHKNKNKYRKKRS